MVGMLPLIETFNAYYNEKEVLAKDHKKCWSDPFGDLVLLACKRYFQWHVTKLRNAHQQHQHSLDKQARSFFLMSLMVDAVHRYASGFLTRSVLETRPLPSFSTSLSATPRIRKST